MNTNITLIVGNLTKEPDLKYLASGTPILQLSIAHNRNWKDKKTNEWKQKASYFDVKMFQYAEDVASKLKKGDKVFVEATLDQESWTNKDGQNRSKLVLNARRIDVIPRLEKTEYSLTGNANNPQPKPDETDTPF